MNRKEELTYLYRIAKHYYQDGMLQNEIAVQEHISRSQVSKLLDKARAVGIVNVTLTLPQAYSCKELEEKLQKRLGLKGVILAPSSDSPGNEKTALANAVAATANSVRDLIMGNRMVGVGWGETLYTLSEEISVSEGYPGMLIIPLIDNATGLNKRYLQTSSIVSRFSDAFMANAYYYNSSDYSIANQELMNQFAGVKKEQIQHLWEHLDVAIFGVGSTAPRYNSYFGNYMTDMPPELLRGQEEFLITASDQAELLGAVFNDRGEILEPTDKQWRNGIDIRLLKDVKTSICIAIGKRKVIPLALAATCGFAKYIVTDYNTAVALDEYLDEREARK